MDKKAMTAEMTRKYLENCLEDPALRRKRSAFTRERKLGAKRLLMIMLQRLVVSLQLGLDRYYEKMEEEPVSKQAFSKARAGLNPEYVRKFADGIAEIHAKDTDAPSYQGMRLIAIDGTDIAVENSSELKKVFGCSGSKRNAATALGSLAYGPLDHAIYDCQLAPYAADERDLAKRHISRLQELGLGGSLLLFDRWYPSAEFLAHLQNAGFFYVMRVRKKWNLQVDAVQTEGQVTLSYENQEFQVRVLKVEIPGGTETLLTNLSEARLPRECAAELYFKRWGVESTFDTLKSKLQLENFSGKTEVSVFQDFYATVYLAGFAMICAEDADKIIEQQDQGKQLKYRRKSNLNRSIDCLRRRFYRILLEDDPVLRSNMLDRLCSDIALRPEPVRPGRSPARNCPRNKRFHVAKKAVLP